MDGEARRRRGDLSFPFLSVSPSLRPSVPPSLRPSVPPSLRLSVSPSLRLPVSLSLYPSVPLSLRLSVCAPYRLERVQICFRQTGAQVAGFDECTSLLAHLCAQLVIIA